MCHDCVMTVSCVHDSVMSVLCRYFQVKCYQRSNFDLNFLLVSGRGISEIIYTNEYSYRKYIIISVHNSMYYCLLNIEPLWEQ